MRGILRTDNTGEYEVRERRNDCELIDDASFSNSPSRFKAKERRMSLLYNFVTRRESVSL